MSISSTYSLGTRTFYGHSGGIDGFRSLLVYLPEEKLALAYISNGVNYPDKQYCGWSFRPLKPFEIPTVETVAVSAEVLHKYVGVYSSPESPLN